MKHSIILPALLSALVLTGCASTYNFAPHAETSQTVRYVKGTAVIRSEGRASVIQVSPVGVQTDGRIRLAVVAYNRGERPSEFGYDNLTLENGAGESVRLFDRTKLEREAKNAATWAAVAVAVGGAAQAYSANQNAYTTTTGTVRGPYGASTVQIQTYDPARAQALTALAAAETTAGLIAIDRSLDETLGQLDGKILQMSTVDPGDSYGGHVVGDRLKLTKGTADFTLTVNYNGDVHKFRFTVNQQTK